MTAGKVNVVIQFIKIIEKILKIKLSQVLEGEFFHCERGQRFFYFL
jgi:hypothetical protein